MRFPRPFRWPGCCCALVSAVFWLAALGPARADMPSQAQILSDMVLANTYFLHEWPTAGCNTCLSGSHASNIWTRGTYFEGALALYRLNSDPVIYNYAVSWGTFFTWKCRGTDATDLLPDDHCCGQGYIELYQLDTTQPTRLTGITSRVNAWTANSNITMCNYVDALHMVMPGFAKLGSLHVGILAGNLTYLSKMYQYFNYAKTTIGLYNTTDHLWYRDATFKTGYIASDGTSQKVYWSRGEGWVLMALARVLDVLPNTDSHYAEYLQTFKDMAAAIQATQRSDGFWNVNLAYANDYPGPESSGTAMFVYGMAWGVNKGFLDTNTYLPTIIKGWNALATGALHHSTGSDNGFLGYEQGSGSKPADSQPVTYTSVPNFDDFGLGAFLLAGTQVYALNALPVVTVPPANTTVTAGQSATFSAQVTGTPAPTYQWQLNGANLTDGGHISGSASANLTLTGTQLSDAGNYTVRISNLAGNATSTAAMLIVNPTVKMLWQDSYFNATQLADPSISGDTATPGHDGISNLLKYAFNLSPWVNAQAQLPQAQTSGNQVTLTFQKLRSDLTYSVQASTDLQNWSANGVTLQTSGTTVTASYPVSGATPAFLRLVVTSGP